jgi:phosphohistidine phosphatase
MRRLLLLRHAKSAWPEGVPDHDRPLAPRGREAAPLVGRFMAGEGLIPDRVVVSTALRTRQTAELVDGAMRLSDVRHDARIYEAPWQRLLDVVREQGAGASVATLLLVGHNPGVAELAVALVDPSRGDVEGLERLCAKVPTAALAAIDFDVGDFRDIARATGRLERFVTPRALGGVDED